MLRHAVRPFIAVLSVLAPGAIGGAVHAAEPSEVCEPAGPIATSAGMTAVATDPDDPKVVWLGSATTLWVSDDEGQTFHLVLQLSHKPEAFGRTVIEALSVGRAVAGWAHGGVGELLAELQPRGAVAPFDEDRLFDTVKAMLAHPSPPLATMHAYTLRAMQDATLALYHDLADDRRLAHAP